MCNQARTGRLSAVARERFIACEGRPPFLSDWRDVVMVHYEVDPETLQRDVPFALDLFDGRAFVSLVAFTMRGLRTRRLPRLGRLLFRPIGSHAFLNVRTYVRIGDEAGIYFLAEFLPNRLSVALGPPAYGLPYRFGEVSYSYDAAHGTFDATIRAGRPRRALRFSTEADSPHNELRPCDDGSLGEFLMERYTAFTRWHRIARRFRIWHEPWPQRSVAANVIDDSLLSMTGEWALRARLVGANYSCGVERVWMGRPRRIRERTIDAGRPDGVGRVTCQASL